MKKNAVLPILAVVPFAYMGEGKAKLDVIGEILANNVISLLSQSLHLKVISRLSATKFRKIKWSFTELHQKLACDFVLHGTYAEHQSGLCIKLRLSIVSTTHAIWEDKIHCDVRDILDSNSYLVTHLASNTAQKIYEKRILGENTDSLRSLDTYELYIGAINSMHANDNESFFRSRDCFMQILNRHPHNSDIQTFIAQWQFLRLNRKGGWAIREEAEAIQSIRGQIDKALDLNPGNDHAIALKAVIETQVFKNVKGGLELITNRLSHGKNDPRVHASSSLVYFSVERSDDATACIDAAIDLSPLDPQLEHFYTIAAAAYYLADRYVLAEQFAQSSIQLNSIHTSPLRALVAIQVALGEIGLAKLTAQRLLSLEPEFTVDSWVKHWSGGPQLAEKFASHLSAAGIPQR